jgi:hypothetical protein
MEMVTGALIILVFASQIIWPLLKGRPTFPLFRKQRELEKSLADANQAEFEAELEEKVKKVTHHHNDSK